MSYFSLVQLQRHSPEARGQLRDLSRNGDAYRDHCLVWKLFPGESRDRDFLFRRRQKRGDLSYYVVSQRPPQLVPELFTIQTKPYEPRLARGEWIRFELQANPTVCRKFGSAAEGERRRSRRHDVLMDAKKAAKLAANGNDLMEEAALVWLLDQAGKWGIEVQRQSVLTNGYTQHQLKAKGRAIQFSSLDYCGAAKVADPALLTTALLQGVGHARAFGCGLLLVRRMK